MDHNANLHIIVEAASTHEGDPATAKRMIDLAKKTGADSVKFQFLYYDGLYMRWLRRDDKSGRVQQYVDHLDEALAMKVVKTEGDLLENPILPLRVSQEISEQRWHDIADYAKQADIPFSASVFCLRGLALLQSIGAPYIKIASCDLNNHALLRAAIATGQQVLVSTGMATLDEIKKSVEVMKEVGWKIPPVLLHCVSVYPCPVEKANVAFVKTLKDTFGLPVGFSDHTENSVAAIAAVAYGATWIEKHMTYDRKAIGLDHAFAMEPDMFTAYVCDLRVAAQAIAVQNPKVGAKETEVIKRARRGLWLKHDVPAGHVLTADDLLALRPEGDLSPADLDWVVGEETTRAIKAYDNLSREDLQQSSQNPPKLIAS